MRPVPPVRFLRLVRSVRLALRQGPAAVSAAVLERSRLEKGGHCAFAFRALHALHIAIDHESGTASGPHTDRDRAADPDGLAFVTHDGLAGGTGSGLTGHHGNRDQCEDRDLEGLKDVVFVFHIRFCVCSVLFDAGVVVSRTEVLSAPQCDFCPPIVCVRIENLAHPLYPPIRKHIAAQYREPSISV